AGATVAKASAGPTPRRSRPRRRKSQGRGGGRRLRRPFSSQYKLAILEEHESLAPDGSKSALLKREGLTTDHLKEWRRARAAGELAVAVKGTVSRCTTPAPQSSLLGSPRNERWAQRTEPGGCDYRGEE